MSKNLSRINNIEKEKYKPFMHTCAGLDCSNNPVYILKVKYINKMGYFCQDCAQDLLQSEFAIEISKGER